MHINRYENSAASLLSATARRRYRVRAETERPGKRPRDDADVGALQEPLDRIDAISPRSCRRRERQARHRDVGQQRAERSRVDDLDAPAISAITRPDGDGADGRSVKRAKRGAASSTSATAITTLASAERAVRVSEPAPLPDGFFGVMRQHLDAAFRMAPRSSRPP